MGESHRSVDLRTPIDTASERFLTSNDVKKAGPEGLSRKNFKIRTMQSSSSLAVRNGLGGI